MGSRGWSKNKAGVRGISVPVHLAGEKKAWMEPLTRALLVEASCPCLVDSTAARLAFWPFELNSEGLQEAEGKVVSSSF